MRIEKALVRGTVIVLALSAMGCSFVTGGAQGSVPPSSLQTTARSLSGPFDFQNLFVPVELSVDLTLFEGDGLQSAGNEGPAIVEVTTPTGETIYRGTVTPGGTFEAEIGISSAWESIQLRVAKAGWESAKFAVSEPARLSRIAVTANLVRNGISPMLSGDKDSDGDGVPDVYDAYPDKTEYAFSLSVPADGPMSVAYEDNFPHVGDGDFNDFVATYRSIVYTGSDPEDPDGGSTRVTGLVIDVDARARVAGYDHEFGFVLNMPGLQGILSVSLTDPVSGAEERPIRNALVRDTGGTGIRIPVFASTKDAFTKTGSSPGGVDNGYPEYLNSVGHTARIEIYQIQPAGGATPDPWYVQLPPFDPYLIPQTGYDVHLIGKPALPGSKNYEVPLAEWEDFRDQAGYPRALLVPTDWGHPAETLHIEEAYPGFRTWRESEGDTMSDWFLRPEPGLVVYPPVR